MVIRNLTILCDSTIVIIFKLPVNNITNNNNRT